MSVEKIKGSIVSLLILFLAGCASGSVIVTGTKRPPVDPSQVSLFLEPPVRYEVIGIVKASSDNGWTEQDSQDYAVQELKNQAASLGANGVLLMASGENTSTVVGGYSTGYFYAYPVTAQTVSGKAIFVSK